MSLMRQTTVGLTLIMLACCIPLTGAEVELRPAGRTPTSQGFYMRDTRHYLSPPASPQTHSAYRSPVRRQDYLDYLRQHVSRWPQFNPGVGQFLREPQRHGVEAGLASLPVLVEFLATGDEKYAPALNEALVALRPGVDSLLNVYPGHEYAVDFTRGFAALYTALVRQRLDAQGALSPEADAAFRDGWLYMLEHLHVWTTRHTFWRGPMHRAQLEGWLRRLAVGWWPEIPEAADWTAYERVVWNDFWPYRDYPSNDTSYGFLILAEHALGAELSKFGEMFTDPQMRQVWERVLYTTCPDGSVIPYGPHGGWNSSAPERMWLFELIARHTRDGRFRWAAQQIFRYLTLMQRGNYHANWLNERTVYSAMALAYLFADDSVTPTPPDGASRILYRKESLTVQDKQAALTWLEPFSLFEDEDKGHICTISLLTHEVKPDKLVLSSGVNPGDMYMLVDLFPRRGQSPLNPGAILGLVQYGSSFTQTASAKWEAITDENAIQIEDVGRTARLVRNTNPNTVDEYYMEAMPERFSDHQLATHAVIRVTDYKGFPVDTSREILFVKNRMVLVRDEVDFREGFQARVWPAWNTQNVPEVGVNWANTFMSYLPRSPAYLWPAPRDLLIYYAPRPRRQLQVRVRGLREAELHVPYQVRYEEEGQREAGERLHWAQLLIPHEPELTGSELVKGILTLADTPELSAFSVESEPGRVELLAVNPGGGAVNVAGLATDARAVYLDVREGALRRVLVVQGTFLTHAATEVFRQAQRGDFERTE